MTDLPPGWVHTTLGEIADTALGKMLDRAKGSGEHLKPYLRNINVQWGRIDESDILMMDVPPDQEERYGVKSGDLLVCEGGEIGRCAIWRGGENYIAYQKALHRVRPFGGVSAEYLCYFLEHLSLTGGLAPYATGSTIKHLPQEQLRQIPVSLPPVEEQRRIVATLEGMLLRLGAASNLLNNVAIRSKALRVQWLIALTGATVADGHEVSQWSIGGMATLLRNGMFVSRPGVEPDGVPILRIGAVRPLSLDISDIRYSGRSSDELRDGGYLLSEGDLIFTRYNGNPEYVGACAVVPAGGAGFTYPDKLIRVVIDPKVAIPEFVAMACTVGRGREQIKAFIRTTAGQAGISGRDLKVVSMPLPGMGEQRRRVEQYSRVDGLLNRLSAGLNRAESGAVRLRRALLAQAFAGRLVPQDPNDEPASELLARIKAERAATIPKQRTRSRRTTKELPAPATRVTGDDYQQETLPL
ncbi:restriction endonuclease subunit S [Micromonospora carbonacea]|uniref:restriction endonuclease subunit S n=1 Tax=Micromonospora carbonacea TaxID=47853 RepID=UPI0037159559